MAFDKKLITLFLFFVSCYLQRHSKLFKKADESNQYIANAHIEPRGEQNLKFLLHI